MMGSRIPSQARSCACVCEANVCVEGAREGGEKPYCLIVSSELNRWVNRDSGAPSHQPKHQRSLPPPPRCLSKTVRGKQASATPTFISDTLLHRHYHGNVHSVSCSVKEQAHAHTRARAHARRCKYSDDAYHHMPHKPWCYRSYLRAAGAAQKARESRGW